MADVKKTSQDLFDKFNADLRKMLKEEVRLEMRNEYDEMVKEEKEKLKSDYDMKLQKIKDQMDAIKTSMTNMEHLLNNFYHDTRAEIAGDAESDLKSDVPLEDVPAIFRNDYERFILEMSKKLNIPESELTLNSIIDENQRIPFYLGCFAFVYESVSDSLDAVCPEATLALEYQDVPLGIKEMNVLKNTKFFRPEIGNLSLCKEFKDDKKLHELLDYVGVKNIYFATLEGETDVASLIEKYSVKHLKVLPKLTSPDFLLLPGISHVEYLNISFGLLNSDDTHTIDRFLCNTPCNWTTIGGAPLIASTASILTLLWFEMQINFKSITFLTNKGAHGKVIDALSRHSDEMTIVFTKLKLCDMELDDANKMMSVHRRVYVGCDKVILIKRENSDILKVDFNQIEENLVVSLMKLGEVYEYDC